MASYEGIIKRECDKSTHNLAVTSKYNFFGGEWVSKLQTLYQGVSSTELLYVKSSGRRGKNV